MTQVRKSSLKLAEIHARPAPPAAGLRVVETGPPPSARPPPLTRRELQCLGWCADGKSYWETAVILGISERTVSFHMEAVRGKLEATTNAHAVAKAMAACLLEPCNSPFRAPRQVLR
jgi:DNA-binding CsgD family transcriptional regulator